MAQKLTSEEDTCSRKYSKMTSMEGALGQNGFLFSAWSPCSGLSLIAYPFQSQTRWYVLPWVRFWVPFDPTLIFSQSGGSCWEVSFQVCWVPIWIGAIVQEGNTQNGPGALFGGGGGMAKHIAHLGPQVSWKSLLSGASQDLRDTKILAYR